MLQESRGIEMADRLAPSGREYAKRLIASAALLAGLVTGAAIAAELSESPEPPTASLERSWQATADRLTGMAAWSKAQRELAPAPGPNRGLATASSADGTEAGPSGGVGSGMPLNIN